MHEAVYRRPVVVPQSSQVDMTSIGNPYPGSGVGHGFGHFEIISPARFSVPESERTNLHYQFLDIGPVLEISFGDGRRRADALVRSWWFPPPPHRRGDALIRSFQPFMIARSSVVSVEYKSGGSWPPWVGPPPPPHPAHPARSGRDVGTSAGTLRLMRLLGSS